MKAIENIRNQLTGLLASWAVFSMISAGVMILLKNRFLAGMAEQFAAWGAINGVIAAGGTLANRAQPVESVEQLQQESGKLAKLLWINSVLDVFYVLGGLGLSISQRGQNDRYWRGHGIGIAVQGMFLFILDLFHAIKLTGKMRDRSRQRIE